ncbi:protein PF14_0175-like [Zerene cesonia]|uniref:protein PF14_0175-like n=1 Tax=Zerene cesonia TaxID=33412 RepID=UPI0018E4F551|nr:protein PF14_0175-like [Zerene cesonia]
MAHVEPMDLDCIESDFDDKENSYQHNNALPRVSCSEKGYEELDVSEFNMKLRYQVTPASSPMSKSYTANCLDNRNISSVEDVLTNNQNLTRSLNSTITNSDSILKSPKSLPLQSISTDQFSDLNRNSSIRRSLDTAKNNVTVTITTPQDLDDNSSLPSTSSSLTHTPEATTPTKEIPKQDGGSPILRGLKSVLSMFRSSQSPIPPHEETNTDNKEDSSSNVPVKDTKPQMVLASTPIRSKNSPSKSGSPLKDSVVFKDDLERELQWKDDSTIIFKEEKIPIHKLFLQTLPIETKAVQELKKDNINTTVEYMDISMNESAINESVRSIIKYEANNTIESDSEFQDCETTFTRNEDDLVEKTDKNNVDFNHDDINMSIVENEHLQELKPDKPQIELNGNKTVDKQASNEYNIAGVQSVFEDNKLNLTKNLDSNSKLEDVVLPNMIKNIESRNKTEEEFTLEEPINSIDITTLGINNLDKEQTLHENLSAIINELNEISGDTKPEVNTLNLVDNVDCNKSDINMSITENEYQEIKSDQNKSLSKTQVQINENETVNLETPVVDNTTKEDNIFEGLKLDETINIETSCKLFNSTSPDVIEDTQTKNISDSNGIEYISNKIPVDKTNESICTTELKEIKDNTHILNEVTDRSVNTNIELNSLENKNGLHINMIINNNIDSENITELQTTNVENHSVVHKHEVQDSHEMPIHEEIVQNICQTDKNIDESLIATNKLKLECLSKLSNDENIDLIPSISNLLVGNSKPDIEKHVMEHITERDDTLLNNIQSEPTIVLTKTLCSNTEIRNSHVNFDVPNNSEKENQSAKNNSLPIPTCPENVNDRMAEIDSESFTIETSSADIIADNISNVGNTTVSHIDSKPSDIPLPLDDEIMTNLNNEIDIIDQANTNYKDTEMQDSDLIENTSILPSINESPNTEIKSNVESIMTQDNIKELPDSKALHTFEKPTEPEVLPDMMNKNDIEFKIENIDTTSSHNTNPEICNAVLKVNDENELNKIIETEKAHKDDENLLRSDDIAKITTHENVHNINYQSNFSTSNEINEEIVKSTLIPVVQEKEVLKINNLNELSKKIETEKSQNDDENEIILQNDGITKITTHENAHNTTYQSNFSTSNEINQEIIKNSLIPLGQEEESIEPSINDPIELVTDMVGNDVNECKETKDPFETKCKILLTPPRSPVISSKGYNFNFDEMDDPFATKTKIRQSPPPEIKMSETYKPTDQNDTAKTTVKKANQNRRKSQPMPRNRAPKKVFNSTFAGTVTTKKDNIEDRQSVFNNDLSKEDKQSNYSNTMSDKDNIEITPDVHTLQVNKSDNAICTEDGNNLNNDVGNEHFNNNTQPVERKSKNVFNIPEIDDKNFNPFATRSKICVSPTPGNSSFVHDNSARLNICNSTEIKISTTDKDVNLADNINSSDISNVTISSKHTDEKDNTVKEIHTEDEDTIEGPFLEAEDLADFERDTDISPGSERDDMIGFDDFPPQTNEDNGDNAEIFIDAQAFEFLLNQNTSNVVADSGKESLFLKFDPLFAKRVSSDGILAALNKAPKRVSTPKKKTQQVEKNSLQNDVYTGASTNNLPSADTADDINMNVSKPTMVVNPAVNSIISPRKAATPPKINRQSLTFTSPAMAVIDRLLSLSGNGNSSLLNHDTSMPLVSAEQHHTDSALIQLREMLAEKEIHVQTLRSESKELKERLAIMESQVRSLETESQDRLRKITDLNEKLADKIKVNKTMSTVVEEYERTIASLVAELEQDKRRNAEERMKLIRDRDEQTAHLASMEVSFSDLHSKYEKSKQIIFSLKANEDTYKKSVKEFEENLIKMQNNYELLKQHATSKLNHANTELEKMNKAHEAEVLKLNAMIKRKDLHITSLEETLAQKTKANEELTAICDELINKVG